MKVGAYVGGYTAEAGGGYTFETDVLQALIECAPKSAHRFAILCPESSAENLRQALGGTALEVLPVPARSGPVQRVLAMLERESAIFRAHWRRPSPLDNVAAAAGVDLVWFIGAGVHRTDLPFITVVWDLQHLVTPWFPEMSANGMWDMREVAYQWFLRRATAVVTGTQRGREELQRYYHLDAERILLLPHPTPRFALTATDEAPVEALPRGVRAPYIFYPAQFWAHKNHVNLILALALLRKRGVDIKLVLVGSDKGNRKHVEHVARETGVSGSVIFPGFVSRGELIALYKNAVALTYVSFCGPENLPPLEAFALGCPVIATRIPGAEEQLGDAAVLVPPDDPAAIAAAVVDLMNTPDARARLLQLGKSRAARWTARDYVSGVFEFLDRFAAVRRSWP